MCLSTVAVALALVGSGSAAVAAGTSDQGWLEWALGDGAASCPTAAAFADKVTERLGQAPAEVAGAAEVRISARIDVGFRGTGHAREWMAEATIVDAAGVTATRRIAKTAETCGPISDALALVTALVLSASSIPTEPSSAVTHQNATPEPARDEQPRANVPSRPAMAAPAPAVPPPTPRAWRAKFEVGPTLQAGRLPGVSLAGEAQAFLAVRTWPVLFADFAYWPEARAQASAGSATVTLWTAGLGACPASHRTPSRLFGFCAGANVGRLHAAGFGFSTSANVHQWVFDLTAAGRTEQQLGRHLFLSAALGVAVPLVRTRVAYSGSQGELEVVFQSWPVAVVCHLGVGYAFD